MTSKDIAFILIRPIIILTLNRCQNILLYHAGESHIYIIPGILNVCVLIKLKTLWSVLMLL